MEIITSSINCMNCPFKSKLFLDLTEVEMQNIDCNRKEYSYKKGDVICGEGDDLGNLIYLTKGLGKLHKRESNKTDQIINIVVPYDFIGSLSIFSETKSKYSVTAIEDSIACAVPVDIIKKIIVNNGRFALKIIENINKVTDDILETRFKLNKKHLRGRIAYIILFFAQEVFKNNVFIMPISRKEIAELINMTTENVIRILSEFRHDGIIEIDGKTIKVIDPVLLQKICEAG